MSPQLINLYLSKVLHPLETLQNRWLTSFGYKTTINGDVIDLLKFDRSARFAELNVTITPYYIERVLSLNIR